jgi:hypothetical protein
MKAIHQNEGVQGESGKGTSDFQIRGIIVL